MRLIFTAEFSALTKEGFYFEKINICYITSLVYSLVNDSHIYYFYTKIKIIALNKVINHKYLCINVKRIDNTH